MNPPSPVPVILVVDDDPKVRSVIVRALQSAGWSALEATDGRAALAVLRAQRVDLLLTDLVMPEGEGLELIMTAKTSFPNLPIVAISGQGVQGPGQFLTAAKLLGAKRTLTKPFESAELIAAVREVLGTP